MHTYVEAGASEGQKVMPKIFLNCSSSYSLKQSFCLSDTQIQLNWLIRKPQASSCLLQFWDYKSMLPRSAFFFFNEFLGSSGPHVCMTSTLLTTSSPSPSDLQGSLNLSIATHAHPLPFLSAHVIADFTRNMLRDMPASPVLSHRNDYRVPI